MFQEKRTASETTRSSCVINVLYNSVHGKPEPKLLLNRNSPSALAAYMRDCMASLREASAFKRNQIMR